MTDPEGGDGTPQDIKETVNLLMDLHIIVSNHGSFVNAPRDGLGSGGGRVET
jgi:hypothetical protein